MGRIERIPSYIDVGTLQSLACKRAEEMNKPHVIRVTDARDMDAILTELDTPMAIGGNTFDGLLVRAHEFRTWKGSQSETEVKGG